MVLSRTIERRKPSPQLSRKVQTAIEIEIKYLMKLFVGILITGNGYDQNNDTLAEIYVPELQKSCVLPTMTMHRADHTQNGFMSCGGHHFSNPIGGDWSYETCEVYVPGVGWRKEPYILDTWKTDHTSWTLKNGSVLLMGSFFEKNITELVTPGVGTVPGFTLSNPIRFTVLPTV